MLFFILLKLPYYCPSNFCYLVSSCVFQEEDLPSIEQLARQIEDEEINLKEKPRNYLKRVYQETIYKSLVEKSILDYLHYNHYHLPMYAWPGII